MTKPKWVIRNEQIMSLLRLDRFPIECSITHDSKVSWRGWSQSVDIHMIVKDSFTGESLVLLHSFGLDKDSDFKSALLGELLYLMDHEVKETIQFEMNGKRTIPFDPHARSV